MDRNATVVGGGLAPEYVFKLWNLIIRPPRAAYDTAQLGPPEFVVNGVRAARRDVNLTTSRGTQIVCSHFVPRQDKKGKELQKFPVIIYLHGNSSSRLEAGSLVSALIENKISLFCFDASGCGLSEGEYVSLGWHERDDLATVIDHLRKSPFCGPIGLWGRSMGAVTALLHVDRDPTLSAICLDSPFADLRQLAGELATSDRILFPVPSWLVDAAFALIRSRVQALADFDIEDLVPREHAQNSQVPAMFMHARQDSFISPGHSRQLYEVYAGDKELVTVDGDHNSERSQQVINHAVGFFKRSFRLGEVDLTLPRHVVDEQCTVPQRDGQPPLRVPQAPHTSTPPVMMQNQMQQARAGSPSPMLATRMATVPPASRLPTGPPKLAAGQGHPSPAVPRNTRLLGGG